MRLTLELLGRVLSVTFGRTDEPSADDPGGYNAPGHMGGSFDDAQYPAGRGPFGFQQSIQPAGDE